MSVSTDILRRKKEGFARGTPAVAGGSPVSHEPSGEAAQWAAVRRYVEGARLFQRASLAARIMAGMGLLELRKAYGEKRGGDRKSIAAKNQKPHGVVFGFSDWPAVVKRELGVSDETARRWMDMARAARPRLTKGDIDLGRILEKHPGALTPAEQELLKTAVHKISDGKTQMEFLLECGVACAGSPGAKRAGEAGASATKGRKRAQTRHFLNARAGLVQTRSLAMWDELKDDGTPHFTPAQKTEVLRRLSGALAEWPAELLSAAVAEAKLLLNQKK